ncbi:MAG: MFS transporter [Cellvibrionaceae bacterium]|nr:MFS transporter [Cellvibrionaceae bacterium]
MSVNARPLPYWRLSGFYFFYFAVLGALVPFWSLYLKHLDYSATEIGSITAALAASRIIAPNLWGWLADISGQRMRIIRWGSFLAALFFVGIFWVQGMRSMLWVVLAYSFFWNAVLAQFEVVTLNHLQGQTERYSQVRLWGSVGFIVTVVGLGALFDWLSIATLPAAMLVLLLAIWLSSLSVSDSNTEALQLHTKPRAGGFIKQLLRRPVILFFLASLCLQVSHGAYYTFFSVLLAEHGYSAALTGGLWALGVLAEIVLFIKMPALLQRFGARLLYLLALAAAALRWLATPLLVDSLLALLLLQCLHALTFGAAHAVSVEWVRAYFPHHHGQGQAFYTAFSFGVGGVLGAVLSGLLWELSPLLCFAVAAAAALLGLCAAVFATPPAD